LSLLCCQPTCTISCCCFMLCIYLLLLFIPCYL
jgi:hypothetical protein